MDGILRRSWRPGEAAVPAGVLGAAAALAAVAYGWVSLALSE